MARDPETNDGSADVVVVGGGLIGTAATRHLAEAGTAVTVVAAPEPQDWSAGVGPFASHYDAGRITRLISTDPVWTKIAARSIGRYADIEARSGITFHDPRGLAWLATDLDTALATAVAGGSEAHMVDPEWLESTTGIRLPDIAGMQCAIEPAPAGVINPREMARAQLHLADVAGATIVPGAVTSIERDLATGEFSVAGAFGTVTGRRVLLATGAYGAGLVGVDLGLERLLRTTVRIDLGPAPEMPSGIADPVPHENMSHVYWNPPVKYPDGRVLFKIGCEVPDAPQAESDAEINQWFTTSGNAEEAAALLATARDLLPHAVMTSTETVPCVITQTASRYPLIGWVDDGVAVAVGGNGSSAKSSDELGRLASQLFASQLFADAAWTDPDLDLEVFAPLS